MSVWSVPAQPGDPLEGKLSGCEGELVALRCSVEPHLLEDLLETLAGLPFPVNPQLQHLVGDHPVSVVEFPAYEPQIRLVRTALESRGLGDAAVETRSMLAEIRG